MPKKIIVFILWSSLFHLFDELQAGGIIGFLTKNKSHNITIIGETHELKNEQFCKEFTDIFITYLKENPTGLMIYEASKRYNKGVAGIVRDNEDVFNNLKNIPLRSDIRCDNFSGYIQNLFQNNSLQQVVVKIDAHYQNFLNKQLKGKEYSKALVDLVDVVSDEYNVLLTNFLLRTNCSALLSHYEELSLEEFKDGKFYSTLKNEKDYIVQTLKTIAYHKDRWFHQDKNFIDENIDWEKYVKDVRNRFYNLYELFRQTILDFDYLCKIATAENKGTHVLIYCGADHANELIKKLNNIDYKNIVSVGSIDDIDYKNISVGASIDEIYKNQKLLTTEDYKKIMISMSGDSVEYNKKKLNERLLKAAFNDNLKEVKNCLDQGADIEATEDEHGGTPLISASIKGYAEIVKLLIDNGANIDAKDVYGRTALMWACYWRHTDIVKLLIEFGANMEKKSNIGLTAFNYASEEDYGEIIDYLSEVRKEIIRFKTDPMKLTVDAPLIPQVQKNVYLAILYKNNIYYIDTLHCLTLFEKLKKADELKKIIMECKFLQCVDKKNLRKSGLPLTGDEFDMKNMLCAYQKNKKITDIIIE